MNEIKKYKLGEISVMKYGKMPDKTKYVAKGYPVFSGYQIVGYYPTYNCDDGEVVIVARGVGGTGDIKLSPGKSWVTNLSIIVKVEPQILNRKYFYYKFYHNTLRYLDSGSAQSQITIDHLKTVELELPSLKIQQNIAFILSSLDDKIELNRRMNQTLEQMAKALFNHYFVDNIDPDSLPEGWRTGKLGEVLSFRNGKSSPTRNDNSTFPVYGSNGVIGYCDVTNCRAKSFIIGRVGSFCGSVYFTLEKAYVTDNAIIGEPKMNNSSSFCNQLLHSLNLNNFKGGSGQPLVNQSVLSNINIIVPIIEILENYEEIVLEFYQKIFQNEKENKALCTIRDTLLPKLMSGEIDVDTVIKEEELTPNELVENLKTA